MDQQKLKHKECLLRYIDYETSSIYLMDCFEGIEKDTIYNRIIDKNPHYISIVRDDGSHIRCTCYVVIERSKSKNYVGDITFTQYKQTSGHYKIRKYIETQLTSEIIDEYLGTKKIFYFQKPYHLRAQNSRNRTGYGSEWRWGELVYEGTLYGETTDYIIAGVIIEKHFHFCFDDSFYSNQL